MSNRCPKCGTENMIQMKQACRAVNCDARILFNILRIVCASCRHEYYTSIAPTMHAKVQNRGEKGDEE